MKMIWHTRTVLVAVLLAAASCTMSSDAPTALDIRDISEFERITALLSAPADATTIGRLNEATGLPPDAVVSKFTMAGMSEDDVAGIVSVRHRSTFDGEVEADGGGPDFECEWINGGTLEDYNEYRECREDAYDDEECNAETESRSARRGPWR